MSGEISWVDVGAADELASDGMQLVRADGHRLVVVRRGDDLHAIDNACPHQGYGLAQGELTDDVLVCQWHNWRFRVTDGRCLRGEEDVRTHPIRVEGDRALVGLCELDPAAERARLLPSLRRALEDGYVGQMARDTVRLLHADSDPAELIWEAVQWGAPRAEFGWGHSLALVTDCLRSLDLYDGETRAHPVVGGLAAVADTEHLRPPRPQPEPLRPLPADPGDAFRTAVEAYDGRTAEAIVRGALEAGADTTDLLGWFVAIASDHHLSFGHQAIYTQKAFELLDVLGAERAAAILPHLVPAAVVATRYDTLPYARKAAAEVASTDVAALAAAPDRAETGWNDGGRLRHLLHSAEPTPISEAARAGLDGAGVEGILDTVVLAAAERILRHDVALDADPTVDFGWLDLTHSLTYAHAARELWRRNPGPDAARLALWTVFHVHDSGRMERRRPEPAATPELGDPTVAVADAVDAADEWTAASAGAAAAPDGSDGAAADLVRAAVADQRSGATIIYAHLVKTSCAAVEEARITGSSLPLAAAARFLAAPRYERSVTEQVTEAVRFLRTGDPPRR